MSPSSKDQPTPPPPGAPAAAPVPRGADDAARAAAPEARPARPRRSRPPGPTSTPTPTQMGQQGAYLTTATGARLRDTDHSLRAGPARPDAPAGPPPAREDHPLRPRAHPRAGRARPRRRRARHLRRLRRRRGPHAGRVPRRRTSRHRCSCGSRPSLGSRGSADTVRDTRGFAVKFYTERGQLRPRRQQHPGLLHPGRHQVPGHHPRRQAAPRPRDPAGAERARHVLGLRLAAHRGPAPHDLEHVRPRHPALVPARWRASASTPSGSSNAAGDTTLVKFHWKPRLGVHSLTWEEAQLLGGIDPDFHRRDLSDAIESGAFPQWELGIQAFPDTPEQTFEGIDLLDPTKLVPEELAPVQPIGLLTLHGEPDELLRRDRAGRLPRRQPRAGHRRHRRPAAAGAAVLLPRHPADPARRTELQPAPDQPAARAGQRHAARRLPPGRRPRRRGAVPPQLPRRRLPVRGGRRRGRLPRRAAGGGGRRRRCASSPRRSTTTSARPGCSG